LFGQQIIRVNSGNVVETNNQGIIRYMKDIGKSTVDERDPPQIDLTFAIEHEKPCKQLNFSLFL